MQGHKEKILQFFGRYRNRPSAGFTLVELSIDLAILAILLTFIIFLIDPVRQINKARDAERLHDLSQIKIALDTYYNDHGCYPLSLPFGSEWREDGSLYMKQVPQDKRCTDNPSYCYTYRYDEQNDTCPQWNVVFGKVTATPQTPLCTLQCASALVDATTICKVSGVLDETLCVLPSATPIPSATPTPTAACARNYGCRGGGGGFPARCNLVPQGTGEYCSSDCNGACN